MSYTEHQAQWPQMIAALAAIDAELVLPEDGCNSTGQTLAAIRALKAKVKVKDGKPNLAHRVIEQRLEPLPRARAEGARITEAYQLAFDILREHNAESTSPPEMIGSTFSWGKGHFTTG